MGFLMLDPTCDAKTLGELTDGDLSNGDNTEVTSLSDPNSEESESLSAGIIIVIVLNCIAFVAIVATSVYFGYKCYKRRQHWNDNNDKRLTKIKIMPADYPVKEAGESQMEMAGQAGGSGAYDTQSKIPLALPTRPDTTEESL